jgi:hypothetical protein
MNKRTQHNVHASTNFVDNWESKCAERHRQQAQDISDEYIIGSIWNTDGHLVTKFHDGKYYWALQHYNPYKWEEIPVSLFLELDKFQRSLDRKIFEKMEDRFKGIESEE